MRRTALTVVAFLALVTLLAPSVVLAQPQPKVTITGFVDNITSYTRNQSIIDNNYTRASDQEWYGRVRVRPDIVAELGTTKFVLGLELDEAFGQTGNAGAVGSLGGTATGAAGTQGSFPQRFGETAGWMLNTDTQGALEIKWAYTEFDLPWIPWATRVRLGAQPFQVHYKAGLLAQSDFAGLNITSRVSPQLALQFTFAQIEEQSTGAVDNFIRGDDFATFFMVELTPFKGLDIKPLFSYARLVGPTYFGTRFLTKGGQGTSGIGPLATPLNCTGVLAAPAGSVYGNVLAGGTQFGAGTNAIPVLPCNTVMTVPAIGAVGSGATANGNVFPVPNAVYPVAKVGTPSYTYPDAVEQRYTIGFDSKWRWGAFNLDPTFFYQWGTRQVVAGVGPFAVGPAASTFTGAVGSPFNIGGGDQACVPNAAGIGTVSCLRDQKMSAWLLDVRGGWQAGPLLVEGLVAASSGNNARQDIRDPRRTVRYYQPIATDSGYSFGWFEIQSLNIDYFNGLYESVPGLSPFQSIGYDKYGLMRLAARASYAVTPAFVPRIAVSQQWTMEKVDTSGPSGTSVGSVITNTNGVIPSVVGGSAGRHSNIGTEMDVGFSYTIAPGLVFDAVYGYMWTGSAMASAFTVSGNTAGGNACSVSVAIPVPPSPPAGSVLTAVAQPNAACVGTGIARDNSDPKNIQTLAARVRFSW
ncbi:MAG: hypothetical protein HYR86_05225 [Candidatus Rokubacteria bacterium]|nr:hypothetical protein [Candidatus Rokubacteria bacterium]